MQRSCLFLPQIQATDAQQTPPSLSNVRQILEGQKAAVGWDLCLWELLRCQGTGQNQWFPTCHHVAPSLHSAHREWQNLARVQLWIYESDVPHMAGGKWPRQAHSWGLLSGLPRRLPGSAGGDSPGEGVPMVHEGPLPPGLASLVFGLSRLGFQAHQPFLGISNPIFSIYWKAHVVVGGESFKKF